jgi:predicted ATPase
MPNSFEADTLEGVMATEGFKTSIEEVDSLLERAVMENLLFNSIGSKKCKFAHDRMKQASQALVPAGKAGDDARMRLAKHLLKRAAASDVGEDWMLFVAADNLNLTPLHGMTPLEMATLNLQVGERANQASAFVPARVCLKKGLESLNQIQNPWKAHYDLSLRLCRPAADVELCLGNCDVGDTCCQLTMEKALLVHDKLRASVSLSDSLA